MPEAHFTRDDLIGVAVGTVLLAPFLLAPGYLLGWIFDLLGFRKESRTWQVVFSLVFSVAVAPILVFLIGNYAGDKALWTFYALACVFALAMQWTGPENRKPSQVPRWIVLPLLGWMAIVWASGIDLQIGNRLYPPVLAYDFNLRTALVDSLARHGLPAITPLFYPGHFVPLRYHYFWFLPVTLAHRLGGTIVGARQSLIAADVWCGWALMAVVTLYLRFFQTPPGSLETVGESRGQTAHFAGSLEQRAKWGIGLLAVGGLALLPNLFYLIANYFTGGWFVYSSAEWWNTQVDAFPHAAFFEAHHVAGLLACLTGFLLLWDLKKRDAPGWSGEAVCAGLCFASGAGLSVYVTFTFAMFLVIWGAGVLLRGDGRERAAWLVGGLTAIVCAAPYLFAIRGAGGSGGSFLQLTIRSFAPVETVMDALHYPWTWIATANLIVLPLNYFLETGAWFLLAWLWWRRSFHRRGKRLSSLSGVQRAALTMFAVSLLVGTFLRSAVINNNDLGWRSVLIAQFIIVIVSVDPLRALWRSRSLTRGATHGAKRKPGLAKLRQWQFRVAVLLILGLASSVYDFGIMRGYFPLSDAGLIPPARWMSKDTEVGRRTFDARQFYAQLNTMIPENVVLQSNPETWSDVYHGLYSSRQTASFDFVCGTGMGGDLETCSRMQSQIAPLFADPGAAGKMDVDSVCRAWRINILVAKDVDPIFQDRGGWPWNRPALAANDRFRAIRCGSGH